MRIGIAELLVIFVICLVFILPILLTVVMVAVRSRKKDPNLQDGRVKCTYCAELIQPDAKVCRFCGRDQPQIIDI